jgi:acyl-CoA synthetase (AMP-forming)/AMP-acid ligase II
MNLLTLLEMAATGMPARIAVGRVRNVEFDFAAMTYPSLLERARAGAATLRDLGVEELVYLGVNSVDFPTALFAAAWAGIPLVPVNYRLSRPSLAALLAKHPDALVVSDLQPPTGADVWSTAQWRAACARDAADMPRWTDDAHAVALLLYTSGTTSAPKAAVLRHQHLVSYLLGSIDFGSADDAEAALVSVPPYHIAGVSNLLSNVYAGRRVVYLENFTPEAWLDCVRSEQISHTLLVPTMIARITEYLDDAATADVPTLRSLAYGGSTMPAPVLERAVRLFPTTDFVNAYGLTETSSTIAVLSPADHRAALSGDELARARLRSAGRLIPGIEIQIRGPAGDVCVGGVGDIFVRGSQVSGEYLGQGIVLDEDGWFATRDRGWIDDDGYLFVEGRTDDTIIRGGENIAPAEIEDALLMHDAVAQAAVVGIPDERWGQDIAAAVVLRPERTAEPEELRDWVRARLRSSKTPALIVFRDTLPHTATGKILRRELLSDLTTPLLLRSDDA